MNNAYLGLTIPSISMILISLGFSIIIILILLIINSLTSNVKEGVF